MLSIIHVAYTFPNFPYKCTGSNLGIWHIFASEGHIYWWHMVCSNMENIVVFWHEMDVCSNRGLCVDYSRNDIYMCVLCGRHICCGLIQMMGNVCLPVLLVTLLIAVNSCGIYTDTVVSCEQYRFSRTYMCSLTGIFVQGLMSIMWNIFIPVFLVTLLIALSSYEAYILR